MKFSLIMGFLIRSDKEFWLTWQRFYKQYFSGKKNIVLDYKHKTEYYAITRKSIGNDFIAGAVRIEAQSEINRRKKEKHQNLLAIMPNAMPYMSEEFQKLFVRDIMELSGIAREEASNFIPESIDEIKAKIDLERLNSGLDVSKPELGQNHDIYIKIFSQAIPSKQVSKAIATRRAMKIRESEEQEQMPQNPEMQQGENNFGNMQNISQAQTMSKILNNNENPNNLVTNQDVVG